jgi:hypothetical protein
MTYRYDMCMAEMFIVDEMQLLGGQQGPTMEVCCI